MLPTPGSWNEVRGRPIAYIEHKLDLTRPDEITGLNKGYNRTLSILTGLIYSFTTCTVTWVF